VWIKAEDREPLVTGAEIVPKAVQASSSHPDTNAASLIDRKGLRDRDLDGLDEQRADLQDMWLSAEGQTQGWLEFDFGQVRKLSTLFIWNFNDAWHTRRGVRQANLSVWTEAGGWRKIQDDLQLTEAEGGDDYDEPVVVTFEAVEAQKVRLDDLAGFPDSEHVGLSEVQFFQPRGPEATRPRPRDGADVGGVRTLELTWVPGEAAETHNVYIGPSPGELELIGNVEQARAEFSGLEDTCKYYWRIDEVQADGTTVEGPVWHFTTGVLAGWWKLDEAEGTKVADSSGNGQDGVTHGDPTWRPEGGRVGGALQFDGVDDYVETGWATDLPAWTVAAWIKSPAPPTSPTAQGPVHRENSFQINWDHGDDNFRGGAGLRVQGTWYGASFGELKADTWYHLAATYDGENLKTFKDGILITDNAEPSGRPDADSHNLTLGKHATADAYFTGTIDDVRIYSSAFGVDQIQALVAGREIAIPVAAAANAVLETPTTAKETPSQTSVAHIEPAPAKISTDTNDVNDTAADAVEAAPEGPQETRKTNLVAVAVVIAAIAAIIGFSAFGKKRKT